MVDEISDLRAQRDRLTERLENLSTRHRRLARDPVEYRHALGHIASCSENCEACMTLARDTLDRTVAGKLLPRLNADEERSLRAHRMLDNVLNLIAQQECHGDIGEALHELWLLLETPPEPVTDGGAETFG